jgi:hypothetical protein
VVCLIAQLEDCRHPHERAAGRRVHLIWFHVSHEAAHRFFLHSLRPQLGNEVYLTLEAYLSDFATGGCFHATE